MAEVRKKVLEDKYNTSGIKKSSAKVKKENMVSVSKKSKESKENKKNFFVKFRIFSHGIKSEFQKVHWPTKENMIKYSIATIIFVIFCGLFFYAIDVIFALIQSLF